MHDSDSIQHLLNASPITGSSTTVANAYLSGRHALHRKLGQSQNPPLNTHRLQQLSPRLTLQQQATQQKQQNLKQPQEKEQQQPNDLGIGPFSQQHGSRFSMPGLYVAFTPCVRLKSRRQSLNMLLKLKHAALEIRSC